MSENEVLKSIGERIKTIKEELTLKDLVRYYGDDFPVSVLISSHLTPHEQEALGLIGGGK